MTKPTIYVLAGVNGSGKSSIGGAAFVSRGVEYYNPDIVALKMRQISPNISQTIANSRAWTLGRELLENAIRHELTFAFETTLGGHTITSLLIEAAEKGIPVKVWYAGLESVELNIARVQQRVARGGHHIPEADIRKRWDTSRRNLIKLLPHLDSLRLYDNSQQADPLKGNSPEPKLLLLVDTRAIVDTPSANAPEWAKPIIAGAMNIYQHNIP